MPKLIDLTGRQIGAWLICRRLPNVGPSTMWECLCACGTIKPVRAAHLASGHSLSCGCLQASKKPIRTTPKRAMHGHAVGGKFSKKYRTWRYVKSRCCDPNHKNANIYNGLLCEAWMSFEQFNRDVPDPPSEAHTIERKDNSKGYEPGNVTWVTMAEQHRNQSNCRWIEFDGRRQLLTDWAKEYGVTVSTMAGRIKRWGNPCSR